MWIFGDQRVDWCGPNNSPQRCLCPNPWKLNGLLYMEKGTADGIKVIDFKIGSLSWMISMDPVWSHEPYKQRTFSSWSQRDPSRRTQLPLWCWFWCIWTTCKGERERKLAPSWQLAKRQTPLSDSHKELDSGNNLKELGSRPSQEPLVRNVTLITPWF